MVVNLIVMKVSVGKNVADTGIHGVTLEVSPMMRDMCTVPEMINVMAHGSVRGFVDGHKSEYN
jgi:hypothetical protein